jgi:hypothetical protein
MAAILARNIIENHSFVCYNGAAHRAVDSRRALQSDAFSYDKRRRPTRLPGWDNDRVTLLGRSNRGFDIYELSALCLNGSALRLASSGKKHGGKRRHR